jgi:hypothetical protein
MPPAASFFMRKYLPKQVPTSLDTAASGIEGIPGWIVGRA